MDRPGCKPDRLVRRNEKERQKRPPRYVSWNDRGGADSGPTASGCGFQRADTRGGGQRRDQLAIRRATVLGVMGCQHALCWPISVCQVTLDLAASEPNVLTVTFRHDR